MKLNCKPGDRAVVLGDSPFAGMIVDVLSPAPMESFDLPDGYPHAAAKAWSWVLKMPRIIPATIHGKVIPRMTEYGVGADAKLRPLRDNDGEDETLTWAGKPSEIKDPACQ